MAGQAALPAGEAAITRILEPLGYAQVGHYPLDRLKMTGRSYAQKDLPEDIAQFFVSELHPERFGPDFEAAVQKRFAELRAEMKRVNEHEQAPRRPRPRPIPGVSPLP